MKLPSLAYERPESLAAGVDLLSARPGSRILAGGQSLVAALRLREVVLTSLVDVSGLTELRGVRQEGAELVIGAAEPMDDLEQSAQVRDLVPALPRVLRTVGAVGVRARATLGGCLAWSDPTSQLLAAMLALGTRVETTRGVRDGAALPIGRHRTTLEHDEVVVALRFPLCRDTRFGLEMVRRTHLTWPTIGAVAAGLGGGEVRLVLFGAAPTPIVVRGPAGPQLVERAVAAVDPADDERAPATYRRRVAPVLATRALAAMDVA